MELVCITEKMCFTTKQEALKFGLSIKIRKKQKDQVAAYSCSHCYYWHLTSATATKHRNRCKRIETDAKEKYRGNLKPYMFNGPRRPKKKKRRR